MKTVYKSIFIGLLFSLFFIYTPIQVLAQQANQRWVCLKSTKGAAGLFGGSATLESNPVSPPLANASTYIIICGRALKEQQQSEKGKNLHPKETGPLICTTGRPDTDIEIYGQSNVGEFIHGSLNGPNPIQSDASGGIGTLTWSGLAAGPNYQFYALNFFQPTPTVGPTTVDSNPSTPSAVGGLQQGNLDFDIALSQGEIPMEEEAQDCLSIQWDPYGRVFDAQSLEPVKDSSVNLLLKRSDGNFTTVTTADVVGGNIINPQQMEVDGMFSFVVPDGVYKLIVSMTNFTFPVTDTSTLHPNYSKIYSDIYPAITGEEIIQRGKMEHRDIPVISLGSPTNTTPLVIDFFSEPNPGSQILKVKGRVSHPFAKVIAYSVKPSTTDPNVTVRYRQVGEAQADKLGNFKDIEIDQSVFESTESFGEIDVSKVDLTLLSKKNYNWLNVFYSWLDGLIKKVEAQNAQVSTLKIDPIPTYLEGYAYDATGNILPNTTVGVYLTFSSKPYYQTKTNENGFFKITSAHLPRMTYELKYTRQNGTVIETTTTQFIGQNTNYLIQNKINLNVYKNGQGKTINVTPKGNSKNNNLNNGSDQTSKQREVKKNNLLLIIGILFLLIIIVFITAMYFMKKKPTGSSVPPTL